MEGLQDSEDILDEDDAEDIEETAPDAGLTGAIEAESAEGRAAGTAVAAEMCIRDRAGTFSAGLLLPRIRAVWVSL